MNVVQNAVAQTKLRVERARARSPVVDVAMSTFKRFSEDDGGTHAAALTYYIFFSIFPILLFAVSALGFLIRGDPELRERILNAGLSAFPLLEDALGRAALGIARDRAGGLLSSAVLLALYSGTGAIVALQHALNVVDHVQDEGTFVQKRLGSLGWLALLGPAALLSIGTGALVAGSRQIFGAGSPVAALLSILSGLLLGTILFASSFKFLSRASRSWREVLPGGIAAALAFEVLKLAGSAFIAAGSKSRSETFGAFATAATALIVSFLICRITLLAAELNAVLAERRLTRQSTAVPP